MQKILLFFIILSIAASNPKPVAKKVAIPEEPPINQLLTGEVYANIPKVYGEQVEKKLFYYEDTSKQAMEAYVQKLEDEGFVKIFGYGWDTPYGFRYGMVKDCTKLEVSGYNQADDVYGMEIKVEKNKTDEHLEKGELMTEEAARKVFKFLNKAYEPKNYQVDQIYLKDLWGKLHAQVICVAEKTGNDAFNGFYIKGDCYLIQDGKVCALGLSDRGFNAVDYYITDFDKDGEYELEQVRYIGSGMIKTEIRIFKDGTEIYFYTDKEQP